MKKGIYFLLIALFTGTLFGCVDREKREAKALENDSILRAKENEVADYYGVYKGQLPAETEDGMPFETTLSLNSDNTFALHATDGEQKYNEQGNFAVTNEIVTLFLFNQEPAYFKLEQGGDLRVLNEDKELVSKNDNYIFKRTKKF